MKLHWVFVIVFAFLVVSLGTVMAPVTVHSAEPTGEEVNTIKAEMMTFAEILYYYATEALEKPADLKACAYEMLRMKPAEQKSCRDKYSVWYPKEEVEMVEADMEGKFGGIGAELTDKDGKVVVVAPIDGTPAFRAGLKPGDEILEVDGVKVESVSGAVKRVRGKIGTSVEIKVRRDGKNDTIVFTIVRAEIVIQAVEMKVLHGANGEAGYLRVKTFSEVMPDEFHKEMTKLRDSGITKVVLDFRGNPGGFLNVALDILYDFARESDTLMVMRERDEETVFDALSVGRAVLKTERKRTHGMFLGMAVVILVNKGSASASEVFAGTMKDWGYPVIGTNTFGKGIGQTHLPLSDGSVLSLTTFEFLVGNSRTKIHGIGVIPTHSVVGPRPATSEILREDKQLEKALELLFK
ncbi:MAG: S41 family peptidase [bacterium]|nr:S41 family peptidase [bacterium]